MKVVLLGPGPTFKGGISNYNTALAKSLEKQGADVHIVSWTQQYPAIIPRDFKDRTSKTDFLEGTNITVEYLLNYNSPASWRRTVTAIKAQNPKLIVIQWAIALQGIPLGWIAKKLRNSGIEVIFDLHLVVQKEASGIDKFCTKYGLKHVPTFITHAYKTVDELKSVFPTKQFNINETGERRSGEKDMVIKLYHPIYDLFQPDANLDIEAKKNEWGLKKHVFLYFGFIRKYKGLHQAIEAFAKLAETRDDVSLVIAGESFWNTLDNKKFSTRVKQVLFSIASKLFLKQKESEKDYNPLALVKELGIEENTLVLNRFIPNEEVSPLFQVSNAILLYYLTATPSGVESLSYNFDLPVLATNVGHFPETIKDGYNGYLAEDRDMESMVATLEKMLEKPILPENVKESAKNMSWENYAKAILKPYSV